jgi:hypothetical protein
LLNPEAVFLWSRLPRNVSNTIIREIERRTQEVTTGIPSIAPIICATFGDEAVAIGAAILAFTTHSLPSQAALMTSS